MRHRQRLENERRKPKPGWKWPLLCNSFRAAVLYGAIQFYTPKPQLESFESWLAEKTGLKTYLDTFNSPARPPAAVMPVPALVQETPPPVASPDVLNADYTINHHRQSPISVMGQWAENTFDTSNPHLNNWFAMLGRHEEFMKDEGNRQKWMLWLSQFDVVRNKSIEEKVKFVDSVVDKFISYRGDTDTFGMEEYWASPLEILESGKDDCEGQAVLKFFANEYLDIPQNQNFLAIIIMKDQDAQKKENEAARREKRRAVDLSDTCGHALLLVDVQQTPATGPHMDTTRDMRFVNNESYETSGTLYPWQELEDMGYTDIQEFYLLNRDGLWKVPYMPPQVTNLASQPQTRRTLPPRRALQR